MKMKCFLIILLFFSFWSAEAQQSNAVMKSDSVRWEKGKKFYIHKVVKGQTVFAISKLYGVKTNEIEEFNPEVNKGIQPGQYLRIPSSNNEKEAVKNTEKGQNVVKTTAVQEKAAVKDTLKLVKDTLKRDLGIHIIQAKETFSSIAKKYGMKVQELKAMNPDMQDNLKIGGKLKVWIVDTLPSQSNLEPDRKNESNNKGITEPDCNHPVLKKTYNICLMLPLYLGQVDEIQTTKLEDVKDPLSYKSFSFIQFYEGVLLAIDSLEKMGFQAKLFVYDVSEDTLNMRKLLQKKEMSEMDLFIGPLFSSNFKLVAEFAKKHDINIVNPFSTRSEIVKNNPNVFKLMPSMQYQFENLFSFLQKQHPNANVIIVHNKKDDEVKNAEKASSIVNNLFKNNKSFRGAQMVVYNETGINGISKSLQKTDCNIILTLTSGEAFVQNYIRKVIELKDSTVLLVGLPEWDKYDNIETEYFIETHLHSFGPSFVEYSDESVKSFVLNFRNRFQIEPELEKYAFQGYDVTFYFLTALMKYGIHFENCLSQLPYSGLQTQYKFISTPGNGFENTFSNISKIENYKLRNVYSKQKD